MLCYITYVPNSSKNSLKIAHNLVISAMTCRLNNTTPKQNATLRLVKVVKIIMIYPERQFMPQ